MLAEGGEGGTSHRTLTAQPWPDRAGEGTRGALVTLRDLAEGWGTGGGGRPPPTKLPGTSCEGQVQGRRGVCDPQIHLVFDSKCLVLKQDRSSALPKNASDF